MINDFVKDHNIESVIDFGAGDGHQLSLYQVRNYVGFELSSTIVSKLKDLFKEDTTKQFFLINEYEDLNLENYKIRKADLTLSIDVIFNLVNDEIFNIHMTNLFNSSSKYVIIYTSNTSHADFEDKYDLVFGRNIKHRKFTDWVEKKAPEWKLHKFIKNRYPFDKNSGSQTSFADFYIFEKQNNNFSSTKQKID